MSTKRLNATVATIPAATETTAVLAAAVRTAGEGTGTSISVPGILISLTSLGSLGMVVLGGGGLLFTPPLTPGGALRSLGGTTRGLYLGI